MCMSARISCGVYVNDRLMLAQMSCSSRSQVSRHYKSECFRAANDLWREVRDVDDATTAIAAQLLGLAYACDGEDALAQDLSVASYEMCKRLGLLRAPDAQTSQSASSTPAAAGGHSALSRRWRAHIAWGVFNCLRQVFHSSLSTAEWSRTD